MQKFILKFTNKIKNMISVRVKFAVLFIIPILIYLWLLFQGFQLLNISPTKPEEAVSIPMQQYARTMLYHQEEMSKEDINDFYNIFATDVLKRFDFFSCDYLKYNIRIDWTKRLFNTENYLKNQSKYMKIWLRNAKKYPDEYLKAFLCLNMPFWYPDYKYLVQNHSFNFYMTALNLESSVAGFSVKQRSQLITDIFDFFFCDMTYSNKGLTFVNKFFPTSVLFSTGFPFWILFFAASFTIIKRKFYFLIPLIIPSATLLSYIFFAPMYLLRYNYAVIVCIPIMFAVIDLADRYGKSE